MADLELNELAISEKRYAQIVAEFRKYRQAWRASEACHQRLSKLLEAQTVDDENCINEIVNNPKYTVAQLLSDLRITRSVLPSEER